MGFLFNSRWVDLAFTFAALVISVFAILDNDDLLIAFCIPAGIGIFRQFMAYMTVPYVLSYGIAVLLLGVWLDVPELLNHLAV